MVSAAISIPSSSCPTRPAASSAAPALSSTTSRREPVLALEDGLDHPRVLVGRAARKRRRRGAREARASAASIACRSTPSATS